MRKWLRFYWFAVSATILIWLGAYLLGGWGALSIVAILSLVEVTFSADNAVVNSKILEGLSRLWQILFMTIGILLAVFVVRFALPVFIVAIGAHLSFNDVIQLALNQPEEYAKHLEDAGPGINAFGGTFLLLIALSFFINYEKRTHWLGWLEEHLGKLGKFDNFTPFVMLITSVIFYLTVDDSQKATVLFAAICAMALHSGLLLVEAFFTNEEAEHHSRRIKTGMAAFITFLYLQVIDASFSLDGVIGAFALTSDVLVIVAGLGVGAVWVRAMTVHMVRSHTLHRFKFLEHGAHWAIAFLGTIMLFKLYGVEPPQWLIGTLGLATIGAAAWWSIKTRHHHMTHLENHGLTNDK